MNALSDVMSSLPATMEYPTLSVPSVCRYVPGDVGWPSVDDWNTLNSTTGGRLIQGVPLAWSCYGPNANNDTCEEIRSTWSDLQQRIDDPVNIMSAYWLNDSCNPFLADDPGSTCTLGNLAEYAINVSDASTVVAGINFARDHNIRLTIKNTGHDFLGRSTGRGALELWTHHLDELTFFNYSSAHYTGPAVRMGAGAQSFEIQRAATERGFRVVGGYCPTVGIAGGWLQGGGHGSLGSAYGLGADNALEYEVVTMDGRHLTVTPTENEDLYWAISGGGPGNYAVVLSATLKAYPDGPVAGAQWLMRNTDDELFWAVIEKWIKYLPVYDRIPGLAMVSVINQQIFGLRHATYPDASAEDLSAIFTPFFEEIKDLPIEFTLNETVVNPNYADHANYFVSSHSHGTNGGRLLPRSVVQDDLPGLLSALRDIVGNTTSTLALVGANYAQASAAPGANAVLPAWRDALASINLLVSRDADAPWSVARDDLARMNAWQDRLRAVTPGGGTYMNEATHDNPHWKEDYFGRNYDRLLAIKHEYDPDHLLWASAAVGSDERWALMDDGRLCAAGSTGA